MSSQSCHILYFIFNLRLLLRLHGHNWYNHNNCKVCLELLKIAGERTLVTKDEKHFNTKEKSRLIGRFRNSFVNLALPMLASTQPVSAEEFSLPLWINDEHEEHLSTSAIFTAWDFIEVPGSLNTFRLKDLKNIMKKKYGVIVDSASWCEETIWADYMPDCDAVELYTLGELLQDIVGNEEIAEEAMSNEDDEEDDDDKFIDDREESGFEREVLLSTWEAAQHRGFVDIDVTGSLVDEINLDSASGRDVKIPPVRVFFTEREFVGDMSRWKNDKNFNRQGARISSNILRKRDRLRNMGAEISQKFSRKWKKKETA